MTDQTQIRQALAEILESPEFKESPRYRDLLTFLVEESLAGRSPKETMIGVQFFGKDSSFSSKEDATVRVYLNNLRKKLDHYYLTIGKTAPIKLTIPVGHYKVEFISAEEHAEERPNLRRYIPWALIAAGFVCAFLLGYFSRSASAPPRHSPAVPNAIWDEFVRPDGRPTLVVLGDYFFMREQNPVSSYYRTVPINSPEDYQQKVNSDPAFAKRYLPLEFSFLRPSATWGLQQILPIIQQSPHGYSIKLASEFSTADFKTHNVIYLGTVKTLYTFRKFLHIFGMERIATTTYEEIVIHGEKDDSIHTFLVGGQRSIDYVKDNPIIAKGAGPEGSTILMLMGFTENGAIAAPRAACDSTLMQAVKSKYPQLSLPDPLYFTLVLATEGIAQAVFATNIQLFQLNKPMVNLADTGQKDSSGVK